MNPSLLILIPLAAAFLLPSLQSYRFSRWIAPALILIYLFGLIQIAWHWSEPVSIVLAGFKPPLGINLYLDQTALLFLFLNGLLFLLTWPWQAQNGQHALLLLLFAASSALILSGDLFNIFVFYELASIASIGLIVSESKAVLSGMRYLLISGSASVLFLCGIALIYWQTGTLNLAHLASLSESLHQPIGWAGFALILLGIGVKAELFPVNFWVPEVYASSPIWLSALLAGLLSKIAILVLARLLILIFDHSIEQNLLLVIGLFGLISAELAAWQAREYRRILAFSSIAQLSLIAISLSIDSQFGLMAAFILILQHALIKPALFYFGWQGHIHDLKGLSQRSPWAAALFILFALSLIGLPPLPGFWAKLLLLIGLGGQEGVLIHLAIFSVLSMTVIEASYLFRLVALFYQRSEQPPHRPTPAALFKINLIALILLFSLLSLPDLSQWLQKMMAEFGEVRRYIVTVAGVSA